MDVCRFGRASDGRVVTVTVTDHGAESGCVFGAHATVGLKYYAPAAGQKAGVWVYGVKPSFSDSLLCKPSGVIPCILPFSTVTNQWSQYSPPPPPPPPAAKKEVYFADKASDYTIRSLEEANAYAVSLGGTLATAVQLRDALDAGLDICRFGRAIDGIVYTVTKTDHGPESGCSGSDTGINFSHNIKIAGAWVYGVKPSFSDSLLCKPNGVIPCIYPFSTKTNKWSQYS